MKGRFTILLLALVVASTPSAAKPATVGEQFDKFQKNEVLRYVVGEVGDAYSWANAVLVQKNQAPLFCQPEHLSMTDGQIWAILETYLKRHPERREDSTEMWNLIILDALVETFPCK